MNYLNFTDLFYDICEIKQKVVKLSEDKVRSFRNDFYKQPFLEWQLSLLWEFIWDDKTYDEIFSIFFNKKMIKKREGDQFEKKQH